MEDADPTGRPLLAMDVDGVISVFGFEQEMREAPGKLVMIDGIVHCIAEGVGERLRLLCQHYEMVWATGWGERANDHLPYLLGLPGECPALSFDLPPRFGTAHWKLEAIDAHAGERPLAWVDDGLDDECHAWAAARPAPTLLVPTDSAVGLTDAQVELLVGWVQAGV